MHHLKTLSKYSSPKIHNRCISTSKTSAIWRENSDPHVPVARRTRHACAHLLASLVDDGASSVLRARCDAVLRAFLEQPTEQQGPPRTLGNALLRRGATLLRVAGSMGEEQRVAVARWSLTRLVATPQAESQAIVIAAGSMGALDTGGKRPGSAASLPARSAAPTSAARPRQVQWAVPTSAGHRHPAPLVGPRQRRARGSRRLRDAPPPRRARGGRRPRSRSPCSRRRSPRRRPDRWSAPIPRW